MRHANRRVAIFFSKYVIASHLIEREIRIKQTKSAPKLNTEFTDSLVLTTNSPIFSELQGDNRFITAFVITFVRFDFLSVH